jgi:hypothetical protein
MILFNKLQEYVPTVFETYVSDIEVDNKHVSKPVPIKQYTKLYKILTRMSSISCSFKIQKKNSLETAKTKEHSLKH